MTDYETINTKQYASVIIVGAGPTGLTMGNLLGKAGIDTLILERNPGLSDLPKAIALDDEGLRVCQAMDLLEPVLQHVLLDVTALYISGKHLLARVAPTGNRNGFPLISTFQQPQLEAILLAGLKRFNCVNIAFHHTVEAFEQTGQGVTVTVRTPQGVLQNITCAYLLACDGGKSSIRRALDIPMQGSTFSQKWLVIDSIQDEDPSTTATFFCNPRRPSVTVPSPHQCRRWEFMLLPGEQEADLLQPETIRLLIQQVGGAHNPHIIRQAIYTFHAVLARTFSKGRVFLLGDAAHQLPPFGGQGMNSGLRDAHNLSWKLSLVLQGLANPSLLDTYSVERKAHAAQMIGLSKFAGNVVMPTSKPVALFRDTIFLVINTIPAAREYFTELHIKPQPRYKKGFLLRWRLWDYFSRPLLIMGFKKLIGISRPDAVGPDLSRPSPIMNFNDQLRSCHPERSEGSDAPGPEILRCAQDDRLAHFPLLHGNNHYRPLGSYFDYFVKPHYRPLAGLMLPQPKVTTLQGDKVLLDEVLGAGFALLRYSDKSGQLTASQFITPTDDIWAKLGVRFVYVQPAIPPGSETVSLPPDPTRVSIVRSDEISAFLRRDPNLFVLVRPDRYIFGAFRQKQAASFTSAFQKLLQS